MGKRKSASTETLRKFANLCDSRFMQRLEESGFKDAVKEFAQEATALLKTTSNFMRLYTLHDETHILNVMAWMEWLVGDVIEELSPIECALCVIAAYAHDLGMTLTKEEHAELLGSSDSVERIRYQQVIDGFVDEKY